MALVCVAGIGRGNDDPGMSPNRRLSRRQVLRSAAATAPFFIAPAALGRCGFRPPSERINLGLIGVRNMGGYHLSTLLGNSDVQIVAVCDVMAATRESARKKTNEHYAAKRDTSDFVGCEAYNEFEKVLERADVDAVVIATPDHWHAAIAIAACAAGKDVYCEKPLSLTVGEAGEMVRAARRYGRVFQTGSQQRSSGEFLQACEIIRNGLIGDVKRVHVEIGPTSQHVVLAEEPIPAGLDYDRWLGPAPLAPYNVTRCGQDFVSGWRRIRDYSGGKLTDWGAHHFDIVQWALGMDESGPIEFIPPPTPPTGRPKPPPIINGPGASPLEPSWGMTIRYAGGVEIIKDGLNGLRFEGTQGVVEVNRGFLRTEPASLKNHRFGPRDVRLYASRNHHQNWIECIRSRARPITDVAIGARSVTVCHLANIALWLDRMIRWDPVKEEIIGDPQAARWLDRPRRAPYGLFGPSLV